MAHEPLAGGYDIEVGAIRLSNYFHVLRELVHLSCGHLALEPRFEIKALLADHLHDDARAVGKLQSRLSELGARSGAPSQELAALLDRANDAETDEYLQIAYGELKPSLIGALHIHLTALDPLVDEPGLRLLTQLLHRQERHVAELPADRARAAFEDLGALPLRPDEVRALRVMAPLDRPARDAFVEVGDAARIDGVPTEPEEQGRFLHGLMDAELCAAELVARNSHEHPDMPWEFHADMARQCWDEIRHAEVHDRLMATELGCHWGDHPVGFAHFRAIYALDLAGRLALLNGTGEQQASWRDSDGRRALIDNGQERLARVLDYLNADQVPHVRSSMRWGAELLRGDEQAYRDQARELRDRLGAPAPS